MAIEMAAGRELDRLIAERVFGYFVGQVAGYSEPYVKRTARARKSTTLPRYSTEIAAAWLVVEHLRSAGFAPLLMFSPADVETDTPCHASLIRSYEEPMGSEIEIDAETMPLAICRAALMAVSIGEG